MTPPRLLGQLHQQELQLLRPVCAVDALNPRVQVTAPPDRPLAPPPVHPPGVLQQQPRGVVGAHIPPLHEPEFIPVAVQRRPGGVEPPDLTTDHRQDQKGLLLELQQGPQDLRRPVEVPLGQGPRHLKHLGLQHRRGHRVDVRLGDPLPSGVGGDLPDLRNEAVHQGPAGEDQVLRRLRVDGAARGLEPPADPLEDLPLILLLELHHLDRFLQGGAELFIGLDRLVLQVLIHKHQAAVVRQVLQQGDEGLSLLLRQLEEIPVRHLHHGPLRHHGHGLHRLCQGLGRQPSALQAVEVEGLYPGGDQPLPQLGEVVFPQIALLAVEKIGRADLPLRQVFFQFYIAGVRRFSLYSHLFLRLLTPRGAEALPSGLFSAFLQILRMKRKDVSV